MTLFEADKDIILKEDFDFNDKINTCAADL